MKQPSIFRKYGKPLLLASFILTLTSGAIGWVYAQINTFPENFQGGDPANHPLLDNYLGIIYKGGFIVPILLALLMMVLTFATERLFMISRAEGRGNVKNFVRTVKLYLVRGKLNEAIALCDKQKGPVANVVRAGLLKYEEMKDNFRLDQDKKIMAIQKDIEETTQLEMPMLEKNLVIISTIASIASGLTINDGLKLMDLGFTCLFNI